MSQICSVCARGALTGNLRSKSMLAVKTRQKVNLQTRRINGKRIRICARCVKNQNKNPEKTALLKHTSVLRLTKRRTKRQPR